MAYITGTANDYAALQTALHNACTANGWTLSNGILSKYPCFVKATVAYVRPSNAMQSLIVQGGTGQSGSTLTNPCPLRSRLGPFSTNSASNIVFPCSYFIFVLSSPDEVYMVVNYSTDAYQWIAFGCSPAPGISGTGNWVAGTFGLLAADSSTANVENRWADGTQHRVASDVGGAGNGDSTGAGPFMNDGANISVSFGYPNANSHFHSGIGTNNGWLVSADAPNAYTALAAMTLRLPSAWNSQAVLQKPYVSYASSNLVQVVGDIQHYRYCKIDNFLPGDIITLGSDKWKVFPLWKKSTPSFTGGYANHTWTFGWAIRYDGP